MNEQEPPGPPPNERHPDLGPPDPPLRVMVVAILVVILAALVFGTSGCVRMREAAYYAPAKPVATCDIPVYDGPAKDGKLLKCISREEWQQ